MGAHDPGQRIAVGDGDGVMAKERCLSDEFLRLGSAFEERERGAHVEFGITGHWNSPCRYHRVSWDIGGGAAFKVR